MTTWLLDTNFVSELKRPNPSHRILAFLAATDLDQMYISTVALAELRFGVLTVSDPARRAELDSWLTNKVRPMFAGRVLEITENIMLRWRFIVEDGRKIGRTFSQPDLIIAATALEHGLTLVTRNVKDFAGLGVTIFNPWV
jgi:toxin FitB